MEKPVIFIVVDSVRSFKTGLDDRDKLDAMIEFGEDSIEFNNAFCSAPSSIMSAASMFTGVTSAYVARNYNDWQFNEESSIISLQSILQKRGYEIFSIDNSKESREMNQSLIMPLKKKYFPKGFSHADFWTNKDMNKILDNLFTIHKPQKKSFFMLWFDCREDPLTSYYIEECINIFKKNNFYNDSIIFLTADHGYPDPRSGLTKKTMKGFGHDMIVTDDNIKIPFYLKYPKAIPRKIDSIISNVDCTPTILELLEIDQSELSELSEGKSLLTTINEETGGTINDRIIRIDTRLFAQNNRVVALRSSRYKFVYYKDQKKYELYDLIKDKYETSPLNLNDKINKEISEKFLAKFENHEKNINKHHEKQIIKNLNKIEKIIKFSNNLFIINKIPKELLKVIVKNLKNMNSQIKIYYPMEFDEKIPGVELYKKNDNNKFHFDYALSIKEKTFFSFTSIDYLKDKSIKYNKILYFDYDMKRYNQFISKWFWPLWKYRLNKNFYKDEPKLILLDMFKILKTIFKKYFRKKEDKFDIYQAKQLRDRALLNEKKK